MRITTDVEAEGFQSLVGEQNVQEMKKALRDGAEIFLFTTKEEIEASALSEEEKQNCYTLLEENKNLYAGWVRSKPKYVSGFGHYSTTKGYYNPHGEWISTDPTPDNRPVGPSH